MLDPFAFDKPKENILVPPKTMVRFCEGAPIIVTGDMGGETRIYRLHGIILKFLYFPPLFNNC